MNLRNVREFLLPLSGNVSYREKLYSGLAALVGLFLVAWISQVTTGSEGMLFMAASMGSAAVLVFAMPHSPMAQPWPLVGGQVVSALIGVLCYQWIVSIPLAAAMAIGASIVAMFLLRCMSPPGGSAALGAVLGGPAIHDLGFGFILIPVGLNALLLLLVALVINNLLPGRRYPLMPEKKDEGRQADVSWALGQGLIDDADLEQAMANLDSYVDADRDELKQIYQQATMNAYKRRLGPIRCADIMTAKPTVITADSLVAAAREMMTAHKRRALPVIDEGAHVIGLVTQEDLYHKVSVTSPMLDIMRPPPETALAGQHVLDIIPLITEKGECLISVVDKERRLLGIITRSDIIRVLLLK